MARADEAVKESVNTWRRPSLLRRGNNAGDEAVKKATGTWDYPIVVIETPEGVLDYETPLPEFRFCLIEGHKRLRYLKAFASQSLTANRHDVFVLTLS